MFWATETGPQAGISYDDPAYVSEQYRDAGQGGDIPGLTRSLQQELAARGGVHVTKDTGMFVVRK